MLAATRKQASWDILRRYYYVLLDCPVIMMPLPFSYLLSSTFYLLRELASDVDLLCPGVGGTCVETVATSKYVHLLRHAHGTTRPMPLDNARESEREAGR